MCNAFRKIVNNVINKRLTGLRSSCCFGDDLLQVQCFEGISVPISVHRLTSDVCLLFDHIDVYIACQNQYPMP